jgi:hypothetical protein
VLLHEGFEGVVEPVESGGQILDRMCLRKLLSACRETNSGNSRPSGGNATMLALS